MQEIRKRLLKLFTILDNISYYILCMIVVGGFFHMNFFSIDINNYGYDIKIVYQSINYIFLFLIVLVFLFLLKKVYHNIVYLEIVLWPAFFILVPYLLHKVPSVAQYNNIVISQSVK